MRWATKPKFFEEGEEQLGRYGGYLRAEQDLAPDTVRNYLSDLRQFAAFCEASWAEGEEAGQAFSPAGVTTLAITLYRDGTRNPARSASIHSAPWKWATLTRWFLSRSVAHDPPEAWRITPEPPDA